MKIETTTKVTHRLESSRQGEITASYTEGEATCLVYRRASRDCFNVTLDTLIELGEFAKRVKGVPETVPETVPGVPEVCPSPEPKPQKRWAGKFAGWI